ncbi:MAG: WhiB family transcriptional regulator [Nesterenkonia sp.]|uniref:WhiB family transcriptional regulator n=1 Tax=Nesterenkonia marinintestina TaxID=2979865 RepID=UPI0021BE2C83|nr:WhiB family transcriptional regulator [Nesterenkonia sp. GX14115]MDO5492544.1 WhiB family transcriptional regulator [Nesterenkonia sp.]
MGNAERLSDEDRGFAPAAHRSGSGGGLEVPADWFVDPVDPSSRERVEHGRSLEDRATAFLTAHEEAEKASALQGPSALSEAPSRRAEHEAPQDTTWLGIPSLVPAEEIEGELAWQVDALCAQTDPEAFFPEKGGSTRDAKKVCGACTVRQECLDYALSNDERFGIWGGLSERERRKLRKRAG